MSILKGIISQKGQTDPASHNPRQRNIPKDQYGRSSEELECDLLPSRNLKGQKDMK